MGICFSSPNVEDKTMRIVMLGIGGSGKSTVTQQLRLLHNPKSGQRAFSQDEILNFREIIWRNMYTAFDDLLQNYESKKETDAHKLFRGFRYNNLTTPMCTSIFGRYVPLPGKKLQHFRIHRYSIFCTGKFDRKNSYFAKASFWSFCPTNCPTRYHYLYALVITIFIPNQQKKNQNQSNQLNLFFRVRDTPDSEGVDEKQELLTAAIELLQDKQFKQICMQPGAHEEIPTLHKFVEKGDEVLSMDYQPSDEDILNCKQRTLGITRARFKRKKLFWEVIDAGGQPVERRKWERILTENISAVIFVAAINEFNTIDRYVESSKKQTRLETSLDTWAGLVNTYGEDMGNWILFLNKTDIFCNKLEDEENVKIFKEVTSTH